MTQAFNLSQLANNLNSSGQLDATDGLVNAVPVANGGTGASDADAARTNLGLVAIAASGSASDLTSGIVATARLGSGTANSTTYLRGDQTYAKPVTSVTAGTGISVSASNGDVTISNTLQTGKILQVLQAYKTDAWSASTSSAGFVDVSGLSISITPSSSSSKILVFANISMNGPSNNTFSAKLLRNGSVIGNNSSNTNGGFTWGRSGAYVDGIPQGVPAIYLDSPSTTSSVTYKIQVANVSNSGGFVYVNYPLYNPDNTGGVSSITVMEIAP